MPPTERGQSQREIEETVAEAITVALALDDQLFTILAQASDRGCPAIMVSYMSGSSVEESEVAGTFLVRVERMSAAVGAKVNHGG